MPEGERHETVRPPPLLLQLAEELRETAPPGVIELLAAMLAVAQDAPPDDMLERLLAHNAL